METQPFEYTSDAPVDPHTEALLATFDPSVIELPADQSPQMVLRGWAALASRSDDRLVIVDSRFRCERNALANVLDDPRVTNAVLLAHNDAAGVNSAVRVDLDGYLDDDGEAMATAGLMVVAPEQLPAFTDGLYRAAAAVATQSDDVDPWDVAVAVLSTIAPVQAVPAAPFCASRVAMELPRRSEEDRRLRASGSPEDTWLTTTVVRPVTDRATKVAVGKSWRSGLLVLIGLACAAAVPLTLSALSLRVAWVLAAVLIVCSTVSFLTSAQLVRYRRRPSAAGAFRYRQGHRWADVLILLGLGSAAASQSAQGWLWAGAALAATALAATVTLTTRSTGSHHYRQWWVLRWLTAAVALVVFGPVAALVASIAISALGTVTTAIQHSRDNDTSVAPVAREVRFLVAPGALLDAGVLVRALSNVRVPLPALPPAAITASALAVVAIGVLASWGSGGVLLVVTALISLVALAWVLARPLQGPYAWAMPAVVSLAEFAVLLAVASAISTTGQVAVAVVIAAVILINGVVADRWQLLRRAPQPWLPVADLGFDGRMVIAAVALLLGGTVASPTLAVLAVWLLLMWGVAFTSTGRDFFPRRRVTNAVSGADANGDTDGARSLKA